MKKFSSGIAIGTVAGIIDVIPMVIQKIPINGCLSAFFMWVVVGFFISTSSLKITGILKGVIVSFIILLPMTFIIAWSDPFALVPIGVMTFILGAASGFTIEKLCRGNIG